MTHDSLQFFVWGLFFWAALMTYLYCKMLNDIVAIYIHIKHLRENKQTTQIHIIKEKP